MRTVTRVFWATCAGLVVMLGVVAGGADERPADTRPPLVLLVSRFDQPDRDYIALTVALMCEQAGVNFDVYYAADHKEGGLFAPHGSNIIGGHHQSRVARALSTFRTTVVRLDRVSAFDSLFRFGAAEVIDAPVSPADLYVLLAKRLGQKLPTKALAIDAGKLPVSAFWPEAAALGRVATPWSAKPEEMARLKAAGVTTVTPAGRKDGDASAWKSAGFEVNAPILTGDDPIAEIIERNVGMAKAIDTIEPITAAYLLPQCVREKRLVYSYGPREQAEQRRDHIIRLVESGKLKQDYAYGRWFGDPQLIPWARLPLAYNVTEPMRNILTVAAVKPAPLPQPEKSWIDLEPSDDELRTWASQGKILATWLLHSGELSHDDAVLTFQDWSAMTKVKIGSGVHWQRYYYDPDAVEMMHVPVNEGGLLGVVEPVLHSTGNGIVWEYHGEPAKVAAAMASSRERIAKLAGPRFAPRGVFCFGDIASKNESKQTQVDERQLALWKAVKQTGFDYLVTSALPGDSRILYRDGDFVVLNQAGRWCNGSPFVRGYPDTFAATEKKLVAANKPGWLVGVLDSPIQGSPIYTGRPYGGNNPQPKIVELYDYIQKGGETGRVISATPRTVARFARLLDDRPKAAPSNDAKAAASARLQDALLVEAESFANRGGWVVDQQSMDVMGSPYLMAHGLGVPVATAETKVAFATAGTYRVWVRTRDWAGPNGPGKFRLHVAGKAIDKTLGVGGDGTWQWHDAGQVDVSAGPVALALEDLTGFNGRCDAILFVRNAPAGFAPPNGGREMAEWRRTLLRLPAKPLDAGHYDLVVSGGGYAGVCAAIGAARLGLKVALIQDRPVLGGNASSEIRVGPIGGMKGLYPALADIMLEIHRGKPSPASGGLKPRPDDDHLLQMVQDEKNISLFLEWHTCAVEKSGARIAAIVAKNVRTAEERRFSGELFADCTGDATVGLLAGADYRMGREGRDETGETLAPEKADKLLLGASNFWIAKPTDKPTAFPDCPWALRMEDDKYFEVSTPKYPAVFKDYAYVGGWNWESGFAKDQVAEVEAVRDHNLRAIFGTWDYLKNRSPKKELYDTAKLEWVAYITGKRESRRLLGDVVLCQQDFTEPKLYPDACVTVTWYFDGHFPHPNNTKYFPGQEFRSLAYDDPNIETLQTPDMPGGIVRIKPYDIPYRCFYSRNVTNLFMAGRNISVTHAGLLPVRVMNTTGMMGTVVGRAAYLCRKFDSMPRDVYEKRLEEFKKLMADPKPL